MNVLTPTIDYLAARKELGEDGFQRLSPVVYGFSLAEGVSLDDPDFFYKKSVSVTPVVNPIIAGALDAFGATRRGRATWQIGRSEESYDLTAFEELVRITTAGAVWPESDLATSVRSGKAWLSSRTVPQPSTAESFSNQLRRTWTRLHSRMDRRYTTQNPFTTMYYGYMAGIVKVVEQERSLWLQFHTTPLINPSNTHVALGQGVGAHSAALPELNLWNFRKPEVRKDPIGMYPAQALSLLKWATDTVAVPCIVLDGSDLVNKLHTVPLNGVTYWPTLGAPARASVAVGANAPGHIRSQLESAICRELTEFGNVSYASVSSEQLALVLRDVSKDGAAGDPAVLDIVHMQDAQPSGSDEMRDFQRDAVGLHAATEYGYVNACPTGSGKTIMALQGMRENYLATAGKYRGLVVVEANVREQWESEAAKWFPEANVIRIGSRADAAQLREALEGSDPVVAIVSYALASDVLRAASAPEETSSVREEFSSMEMVPEVRSNGGGVQTDLLELLSSMETEPEPQKKRAAIVDHQLGADLLSVAWDDLIVDEGLSLKNTSSIQTRALWELRKRSRKAVALTATPLDRGIDDLGALVAFVRNERSTFHGKYRLSRNFDVTDDYELKMLSEAVGPILFRVEKSEMEMVSFPKIDPVLLELEPTYAELALSDAAQTQLKQTYDELVAWMDAVEADHQDSSEYADAREALRQARYAWQGGATLARMVASDAEALSQSKSAGAALLASQGLVHDALQDGGTKRRTVVKDTVQRVQRGEKLLIFTDFSSVAQLLIADLREAGVRVGEVLGGGGVRRAQFIKDFTNGDLDVLVCTSAGERGLNLQAATTLVHYDIPWSPQRVIQRMGRLDRMDSGNSSVSVLFPVMKGTIEERIASIVIARAATLIRTLSMRSGEAATNSEAARALSGLVSVADRDLVTAPADATMLDVAQAIFAPAS